MPLSYVLKTGDQIEIITAENERPKREWLDFVKTRKARNIIMDQLKSERQESIRIGKQMLDEQLEVLGYKITDKTIRALMSGYEIYDPRPDEMYFRIGAGIIKLSTLSEILKKMEDKPKGWSFPWFGGKSKEKKTDEYIINGNDGHRYIIASCCNPIPGDSVVGFKDEDGTVTVHKRTCATANNMASKYGDKLVVPKWDSNLIHNNLGFLVRVSLKGFDRIGIINEITRYISFVMSINIRSFSLSTENGVFDGHIDLYVHDMGDLEKLIRKLQKIEGIQSVVRTEL